MSRAFCVSREDSDESEIFFAATEEEAVIAARTKWGTDDDAAVESMGLPAFDAYSPGPVPIRVLLDAGWMLSAKELGAEILAMIRSGGAGEGVARG